MKARGEMLKQVNFLFNLLTLGIAQASLAMLSLNRKFQHDATQKKRLKDAKPKANSRGLLSPWKQKRRRNGV